jgi:sterol desaturase/sphingolipid hydroxylase (fatty acid hydroxylase superfamily)
MCLKTTTSKTVRQSSAPAGAEETKLYHPKTKVVASTHSLHKRETKYDLLLFLLPALLWKVTPIMPAYLTGIVRILSTHLVLTLHYLFCDKDNYLNKLTQKQLRREKDEYLVGTVLHMWAQLALQIIFPGMFFTDNSFIKACAINTFWSHVLVVEPLYYAAHRWLHFPEHMKGMHGFHHLSIHTLPSTSLVQNFEEHFIYIATFGPAFLLPYFLGGCQHWVVIGAYLVLFDIINAFGHMNIRIRNPIFTNKWSPLTYLFYTPEFHLGHHAYFRANYGLFMPLWDFAFGTHREYKKPEPDIMPADKQDFVFIGHNGGLGHLFTCAEFSVYNVYDKYRQFLPLQVEFILVHMCCLVCRLFMKSYKLSRYLINGSKVGRIICVLKTPVDYIYPSRYAAVNKEIVQLIKDENKTCGTRYFGLGNLNKMKQLNDGGKVITEMVKSDPELKDKKIRIWTGDTMTAASVYNQIVEIPGCKEVFYIGANGKIGNAVCNLITKNHPDMKICVFSSYHGMIHPNITYTTDLLDMLKYRIVVGGKIIPGHKYAKAFKTAKKNSIPNKIRFVLDYTVPFIPIDNKLFPEIQHIAIGLLKVNSKSFLRGHFDICMSHDQDHIYPCHAGCIMNAHEERESDETGDIDLLEMEKMWKKALNYGFQNRIINYKCD